MTELEALFCLSQVSHFTAKHVKEAAEHRFSLIQLAQDPESYRREWPNLITDHFVNALEEAKREIDFAAIQKVCESQNIRILTYQDVSYPKNLKQIYDPPIILYIKGTIFPEDETALAIVGSRHASPYGMRVAHRFAYELSECGMTIVSGLARGVDAEAHRGTLDARGRTIAVLGCGVDVVYPKENKKLYEQIAESGALISEFPLGAPPMAYHFPRRNRIIAGLSLGVLVVEAHSRSGSLITASLSAEEGREVYVVPGPIDSLNSKGTNRLIQEGAKMVLGSQDIIEDLRLVLKDLTMESAGGDVTIKDNSNESTAIAIEVDALSEDEKVILNLFQEDLPLTIDELLSISQFSFQQLNSLLIQLEIKEKIKKKPGGFYHVLWGVAKDL